METTRLCDLGLSLTLTAGQENDDSQYSLSLEVEIVNDCLSLCNQENVEEMAVVEALDFAEVAKTAILGVSGDEDVLINELLQAADGSQTSSIFG